MKVWKIKSDRLDGPARRKKRCLMEEQDGTNEESVKQVRQGYME